jgi:hypothetical protein
MSLVAPSRALLRVALPLVLIAATTTRAHAEGNEDPRAVAGAGVALPVVNRTLYGAGAFVQGGADFPLGSGETHRLRLLGGWIGLDTVGAHTDLGRVEAAWRVYPGWGKGLLFELGGGALFEVERLQLNLPGRALDASKTRAGVPLSAAVGFGLWRRIELELGYQELLFLRGDPWTYGLAHLSIGGRL